MPEKILIVDDNGELLELLNLHCREAGFATTTATNGVEALKQARSESPDLILLDMLLPELDGFAVCEILRKDPATASIPIIALTGLSSQLSRCAGIESGATDFISKPCSPQEIIARIKKLLQPSPASAGAHEREQLKKKPRPLPARASTGVGADRT